MFLQVLCYIFLTPQLLYSQVLIPTAKTDPFNFKAQLYKTSYQSFTDWYLEKRTTLEEEMLIIDLFNKAQSELLNNDQLSAQSTYLKIINMEHDKDWKKPQRQLIVDSYQQLIKVSSYNKDVYKHRLQAYTNEFNDLNSIKNKSFATYNSKHLQNWSSILINGAHYQLSDLKNIKFYNTVYRWTLLSDKAQPHTLISHPREFFSKVYPPKYFYSESGNCNLIIKKHYEFKHLVFSNKVCELNSDNSLPSKPAITEKQPSVKIDTSLRTQVTHTKWYRSKWLWMGAAILTGAYLYKAQSQSTNETEAQPTHTEGF